MANTLLTIDMITREALRLLENNLVLVGKVNRQYDDSFAVEGAKIGSTLRIRKPERVLVSDGATLVQNDITQQNTTLTVNSQKHIGFSLTSKEMTMSLQDYSDNVLKPRISQLAATIDADVARGILASIGNSVGTPGTTPATSAVLLAGQQRLSENAVAMDNRFAVVNPAANAALVEGLKGLFNPTSTVARQFKSGLMGEGVLGYEDISMSQSIANFTTGTRTSGTVGTTISTQGQATIALAGLGNAGTVKAGDVFTVAGVYAVNPQTRESTGSLFQFVAKADATADGAGAATVTIDPIYTAAHAYATVDAFPQSGAAATFLGAASTGYAQNLILHKDAVTFATADLVLPKGVDAASRVQHNGISLRAVRMFDIINDKMIGRIDVLYGYGVLRPEAAVRLWG